MSSLEENSKGKEWELQDLNTKYKKVIKELKVLGVALQSYIN